MVWVFTQRRAQWELIRNWFLAMNFMAVLLFFLLPTAPPRMIFTSGIVDMSLPARQAPGHLRERPARQPLRGHAQPALRLRALHRAGPLHAGATALAALGRASCIALVLVAIVATGNHFIVDAVASVLVVLAA